jgi:hypothetical protein
MNIINQMPFLRTSREFPTDLAILCDQVQKAYVDTANCMNQRIIGLFPTLRPAITGQSFFLAQNIRRQLLVQVYEFTSTAAIPHNITDVEAGQFIRCEGSYADGTNTYGLFFASSVAIAGQITFYVTATQIVFSVGAGAPALTSGKIILQWLTEP